MTDKKCDRSCAYWAADPDGSYCGHSSSMQNSPFGRSTNFMSVEGLCGKGGAYALWEPAIDWPGRQPDNNVKPYETRDGYIGHPVDYAPSNMNLPDDVFNLPGWIKSGHPFRSGYDDLFFVFRYWVGRGPQWLTVVVYEADLRALDFNADDIAAHAIVSACSTAGVGKSDLTLVGGLRG